VCVCIPSAVRTLCPNELMRRKKKSCSRYRELHTHSKKSIVHQCAYSTGL